MSNPIARINGGFPATCRLALSAAAVLAVAATAVEFENGVVAHFHLSWISPVKLRRMIVAGSEKMAVYDAMNAGEKIKIFDLLLKNSKLIHVKLFI